ncbi:nitroreductase [Ignisphaera aggregans DSM 17230]|uniref:Nitroreductase n=1 Tax=Ignisphaera aggregans (strain DSM 17230 / JCM 13409 / AQ1.S1) TaxID=583356 RepID=E0SQ36_IGNAA|nr:nitroreductase [Ignisphaera aggregans DSM 17230]
MIEKQISGCSSEELLNFLLSRRSIRRFRPDPIPLDIIKKIINVARFAPSARNSQPWIFIIVNNDNVKEKLASLRPRAETLLNAPMAIVVACNRDEDPVFYQQSCSNAIMYIMLAAHALGLGSVWLGIGRLEEAEGIQKILELPLKYIPIAIIAIGYPAEKPEPRPRKELKEIAFLNSYGNMLD